MLTTDGKNKYVCPDCGGDAIGESGMGEKFFHCFGHCMMAIPKDGCPTKPIAPEEAEALRQEPY